MNQLLLERDPLRSLLARALGPLGGTLLWLIVRLVSAVLYPGAWAWAQLRHWHRQHEREHRLAWAAVAAASALLATGVAVARHAEPPSLLVQAAAHAADGCIGGHRSPRHC